jgi:hypothetical protein
MTILQTEVPLRLSRQEAELCVLRVTGRVRDPPQGMSHMHTLQVTTQQSVRHIQQHLQTEQFEPLHHN